MHDVAIYGAGKKGRILLEMLQPILKVRCFIDGDKRKQGQYIGIKPILSPEMLQNEKDLEVVMSVQSEQVEEYLQQQNINYYNMFHTDKNFFNRLDVKGERDTYLLDRFLNNFQETDALFYEETMDWYRKDFGSKENETFVNKLLNNENAEEANYNNEQLFYDEYFENRADMRLVFNLINKKNKGKSICDIGFGYGELVKRLHLAKFKAMGIDGSEIKVEYLRKNGINAEKHDIECMNLKEKTFDVVTCLHVLEHVKSVNKLVETIYNIMNHNGQVYASVPYEGLIDDVTHVRQFTVNKLANLFMNHGFKIINIQIVPYLNYEFNNTILLHAIKK